jgi:hypothetical protein
VLDAGLDLADLDCEDDAAHRVESLAIALADVAVQADDTAVLGLEDGVQLGLEGAVSLAAIATVLG